MSGDGRIERASSSDLADLVCDAAGTSMQVAAVLVLQPQSPVDVAVREVIARVRAATAELRAGGAGRSLRSSLNQPTGRRRALTVNRADLAAVLAVAHVQGGTVNDIVLRAVTGALRRVLAARGVDVDRLVVPARRQADATQLGNQIDVISVMIPTTGEPIRRLAAVLPAVLAK